MHKMLHYDRTEVFKHININKTGASKERIVYHYRYSLDEGFHFQSSVCNSCQDVLMMLIKITSIAILNIHSVEYCFNH